MALLNKAKFLEKDGFEYRDVYIDGLGGEVRIRSLSIADQIEFEKLASSENLDQATLMFNLIIKCCVDEEGDLLFEESDTKLLQGKSADVIVTLFKEILKINNINPDEVEDLAKN